MIAPQTIVGGRYRVLKVLGGGGMKLVYLAEDLRLADRPCALAEMVDSFTSPDAQKQAVVSFQREADMLARLSNEHIPRVFDRFSEANHHFLVMEYIDGATLEDEIKHHGGRLPAEQVVEIAIQVLETLAYLHTLEPPVIYRDLKPSNIMVTAGGAAKLIDFGIARHFQPFANATMIGTQGYAPPEQYRGKVETRSDIYALGATMHHAISGRDPAAEPPFSFPPLRKLCPDLDSRLAGTVDQALAYDVANRIPDAADFKRRLLELTGSLAANGAAPKLTNGAAPAATPPLPQLKLPLGVPPVQTPAQFRNGSGTPAGQFGSSSSPSIATPSAPTVLSVGDFACPVCRRPIPTDSRFCSYCAANLQSSRPANAGPNEETVLLSGGHSPEPEQTASFPNYTARRRAARMSRNRRGIRRPVVLVMLVVAASFVAARMILQNVYQSTVPPNYRNSPPDTSGEGSDGSATAPGEEYSDSGAPSSISSAKLAELRAELNRHGFTQVKFRLDGDTLVLSGTVPTDYDHATVEYLCFMTTGIFSLRDNMTVAGGGDPFD